METIIKHSDSKIENNVLCQLEYDPSVKVAAIGILIKDGTEWWYQKGAAGNIIPYVPGVVCPA
jgi:hypothetical protein